MGLVSAIVALCKAVPVLERLLFSVAAAVKEAKAKARYEAKLDHIDDAFNAFVLPDGGVEQRRDVDKPPAVSGSGNKCACMDKGSTPKDC